MSGQPITTASIDHTGLNVADREQAIDFFASAFGFELSYTVGPVPAPKFGDDAHIMISVVTHPTTGQRIELLEYQEADGRSQSPAGADTGAAHIALAVDDVDAAADQLIRHHGMQALATAATAPAGHGSTAHFQHLETTWGLDIELITRKETT